MAPLCSTNYCLANPGSEYLIYRHGVGPVDVQLGNGSYTATWFDVERGSTVVSPDPVEGGGLRSIVSPFAGPAVLHLSARAGTSPAPPAGPAPGPPPPPLALGWMSGWTDRKSIVIPAAQVTGDHTAFPVLIQFSNDSHLSSRTRADGSDLVFTAGDGMTRLAHSIQKFDRGGGNLTAWVKVPRLSDTSDTKLYLYFGHPGSGYEQTPQDVWTGGYTGVWHLNDAQPDVRDATSFQHHAVRSSTQIEPAGKIAGARRFVRSLASFIEIPATPALIRPSITAEAWIHASPGSSPFDVISIGDTATVRVEADGRPSFYIFDGSYRWTTAGHSVSGAYHHVAGVYDAASERLTVYVDGEPAGTASASQIRYSTGRSIAFGMNAYPSSAYHFDGVIDEVRLSAVPRSAAWMRTQFRNQSAPATFHHIGPIETYQE